MPAPIGRTTLKKLDQGTVTEEKKQEIGLGLILVGKQSELYRFVQAAQRLCQENIHWEIYYRQQQVSGEEILNIVDNLNKDRLIHYILVGLPLPTHIAEDEVIRRIDLSKKFKPPDSHNHAKAIDPKTITALRALRIKA